MVSSPEMSRLGGGSSRVQYLAGFDHSGEVSSCQVSASAAVSIEPWGLLGVCRVRAAFSLVASCTFGDRLALFTQPQPRSRSILEFGFRALGVWAAFSLTDLSTFG